MKQNIGKPFFKYVFIFGVCMFFFSCKKTQTSSGLLPEPSIEDGIAKVSGKVINPPSGLSEIALPFPNPVTAEESIIETNLEEDGSFLFEVPIECSIVFAGISASQYYSANIIALSPEEETKIELKINREGGIELVKNTGFEILTKKDMLDLRTAMEEYIAYHDEDKDAPKPVYEMTPEEYAQYEMNKMKVRIDYSMEDIQFSDAGMNLTINEMKLFYLSGRLFAYKQAMRSYSDKDHNLFNEHPQEPERAYYSFLKSFNLNDPQYLYVMARYSSTMRSILSAPALNIPPILDTPIDTWLKEVKANIADLLGFDSGQFYDMLVANAYAKQFKDDLLPLSDKQIKNIKNYFGEGEIAKILLRKDKEIQKRYEERHASIIKETPAVPKEQLMDAIISNYKGKVVLVDFWATWCEPCLTAMEKIKTIKEELKDKNVVYVYLTTESSPKDLWNTKIKNIQGEHYYLNGKDWDYILDGFKISGIPAYLLYDANGVLKNKQVAYPGTEEMRKRIVELLP
jgi:thiol-disulfide isomerase/thioredoxin